MLEVDPTQSWRVGNLSSPFLQKGRKLGDHLGPFVVDVGRLIGVGLQVVELSGRGVFLDFGFGYVAVDQLGQFLGGGPGQQVIADILALKATFVLCRNIDPIVFSDRQVLGAVGGDHQQFPLGLLAFAGQKGQLVDPVDYRVLR